MTIVIRYVCFSFKPVNQVLAQYLLAYLTRLTIVFFARIIFHEGNVYQFTNCESDFFLVKLPIFPHCLTDYSPKHNPYLV